MSTEIEWKRKVWYKSSCLIFALNPSIIKKRRLRAKQNLRFRNNMKSHLVTIIVMANVYWILGMCARQCSKCFLDAPSTTAFWDRYYHHAHFTDKETRPEKLINFLKFTWPVSSEAGVKLRKWDTIVYTFNFCAMPSPTPAAWVALSWRINGFQHFVSCWIILVFLSWV